MAAPGSRNLDEKIELRGETDLLRELSENEPAFREVQHLLVRFQSACQETIKRAFKTQVGPASTETETRIWDAHVKINSRFRKLQLQFREEQAYKRRPVEDRKLKQQYWKFINSSQQFYDEYIASVLRFNRAVPELQGAAKELNVRLSDNHDTIDEALRQEVLASCHSTFIRLGDLARYYQMELVDPKKRNWKYATKYYKLACAIKPESGVAYNQLAIVALAEGDHLHATYYIYRALCGRDPHPPAKGNLDLEFKKILTAWSKGKLIFKDEKESLISSFTYFHAKCYKQVDFSERDEVENEILQQMAVYLKENSMETSLLQKLCLINIAAEEHARENRSGNAHFLFRQLNVKAFFTLLQILFAELESSDENFSAVARQVLPALRNYSSWLLINGESLVSETRDTPLYVQIKEFWKMYASALTLFTSTFDVTELPEIEYLLREDEETIGFGPLVTGSTVRRYVDDGGNVKPKAPPGNTDDERTNSEMLFRIREFVVNGLEMAVREKVPIVLTTDNNEKIFVYKEEGLPPVSTTNRHSHKLSSTSVERDDIQPRADDNGLGDGRSLNASISGSATMNRMVDDLVDSEADRTENSPINGVTRPWPDSPFEPTASVRGHRLSGDGLLSNRNHSPSNGPGPVQTYSPGPPLPAIWNTAFTPQPGEISPPTRPSTAIRADSQHLENIPSSSNQALGFSQPQQAHYRHQPERLLSTPVFDPSSSWSMSADNSGWHPVYPAYGAGHSGYIGLSNHEKRSFPSPYSPSILQSTLASESNITSSAQPVGASAQRTPPNGQGG